MKIHKYFQAALFSFSLPLVANETNVHFVNAVTGKIEKAPIDYVLEGDPPTTLKRCSLFSVEPISEMPLWKMMEAIGIYPHLHLYVSKENGTYEAALIDDTFGKLKFAANKVKKNQVFLNFQKRVEKGGTALTYKFAPNGKDNPHNFSLEILRNEDQAILKMPDGGKRIYILNSPRQGGNKRATHPWKLGHRYRLIKDIHANGTTTFYHYKGEQEVEVEKTYTATHEIFASFTIRPCWFPAYGVSIQKGEKVYNYNLTNSDGQIFVASLESGKIDKSQQNGLKDRVLRPYSYLKDEYIGTYFVESLQNNKDTYHYCYALPEYKELEDDTVLVEFNPTQGKVVEIFKNKESIATFTHERKMSKATFADGSSKKYHYSQDRLTKIESFDPQGALLEIVEYGWEGALLKRKFFSKIKGTRDRKVEFSYNSLQNMVQKTETVLLPLPPKKEEDEQKTEKQNKAKQTKAPPKEEQFEGDITTTTYEYDSYHKITKEKQHKKIKKQMSYAEEKRLNRRKENGEKIDLDKEKYEKGPSTEFVYHYDKETGELLRKEELPTNAEGEE